MVTYKGTPVTLLADFSIESLQARKDWQKIFKVMKSKGLQLILLYPERLSFRTEGEIKSFPVKKKTKGINYYQTSIIRNIKGPLKNEEEKEKEEKEEEQEEGEEDEEKEKERQKYE